MKKSASSKAPQMFNEPFEENNLLRKGAAQSEDLLA